MENIWDNPSSLPEWDDERFRKIEEEDGATWSDNAGREACKALYNQWREVMAGLNGLFSDTSPLTGTSEAFMHSQKNMVMDEARQVAVKVRSADTAGFYVLKMENAAVIRKSAQFVASQILAMADMGFIEAAHAAVVRADIDSFRLLFRKWIRTFEKDEYEDEWGFFV